MSITAQPLPTGSYALDPVHSSVGFTVKHNGVSTFRGQFEQIDAELEDGVLIGSALVGSIKSVIPQLKAQLLAEDFFNAAETHTVEFCSTAIRIADDGSVEVDGDLTIRGVTKPITASGTFAVGVGVTGTEVVGFDLEVMIDRREYGMDWQAPLPGGGNAVGWDVALQVHLQLVKT
jgi:polyisoprenoid-binding protein YceI